MKKAIKRNRSVISSLRLTAGGDEREPPDWQEGTFLGGKRITATAYIINIAKVHSDYGIAYARAESED